MNLADVFEKYGSDKDGPSGYHSYAPVFDVVLGGRREQITAILEVGVRDGASLLAWREWLPNAAVVGFDNGEESGLWKPTADRIVVEYADSTKPETLNAAARKWGRFDCIVDDGCHKLPVQIATFAALRPFLAPGGVYVCEDVEDISFAEQLRTYFGGTVYDRREVKQRHDDILWVRHF